MLELIGGVVLGTLGAWFLLRIDLAEGLLLVFMLGAAVIGSYWLYAGGSLSEIAKSIGIFMVLIISLGSIRVSIEKLSDKLVALLSHHGQGKGR